MKCCTVIGRLAALILLSVSAALVDPGMASAQVPRTSPPAAKASAGASAQSSGRGKPAVEETQQPQKTPIAPAQVAVQAAVVQALLAERAYWVSKETATTGPVLLTVLGAALIVGGIALSMHTEDQEGCPSDLPVEVPRAPDGPVVGLGNLRDDPSKCGAHPYTVPGATMLLVGAAGVVGGVGLMFSRMSEARRQSELQRIDANLKEHGVQLAVTPWLNPSPNVGISYGLRAAGTF